MPCYDPRDDERYTENDCSEKEDTIREMEADKIKTEVEVCKIMSAAIEFLEKEGLMKKFTKFEQKWKPKKGLMKYHITHRKEDQEFYVKELKDMVFRENEYTKKEIKGMKKEIKFAEKQKVKRGSKSLTKREIFSSKYLKASR